MKSIGTLALGIFLLVFVAATSAWAEDQKGGRGTDGKDGKKLVLDKITVTETRYDNPVTPVDTRYGTQYNVVTEEQIREQNSYDFQSTLRDVPGVMYQSKNLMGSQTSHSLYIRGRGSSHPSSDIVVQFDGAPRYGGLFGQVLGDAIAVPTIGSIEVYKSPQPSQFGSGYAAVNILPKYMKQEGQEGILGFNGGSYGSLNENVSAGLKKGPFDIYGSQNYASTDGDRANSASRQQSLYANAGYQATKEWTVRFLINQVNAATEAPMPDRTPDTVNGVSWPGAERYKTDTLFATLTVSHKYERASGYLKGYWNDTTFELLQELTNGNQYANGTGGLWSRQKVILWGARAKETLHLWQGGEIILGADLDMTRLKNTQQTYSGLPPTGTGAASVNGGKARRVWDFPDTRLLSPYIAASHTFGRPEGFHVTPSAGVRYFNHDEFQNKTAPQAGLVVGYANTDLKLNYARGVNYPSPVVLMNFVRTDAPVADAEQYWRNIKPEVVDHYEASLTHSWPKVATLGATVFRDKGSDRFLAYMGGAIPTQFNDYIGHYEIEGLELSGTVTPLKNLEFFSAATWLTTEAKGANNVESNHIPYTPGFQFQAGVKWKFLDNFQVFADMQHLSNLYQGTFARGGTLNTTQLTAKDKLDDITLVNARISYRFNHAPLRIKDSDVFFAVNNIFNSDYEYARGYPMPGTTFFGGFTLKFN